jgi:PIN domain nuclease of toxin-antitoxin system
MDTHVWFWSLSEPENLSRTAYQSIEREQPDQRGVASISLWEFAMMIARGRIELKTTAAQWLEYAIHKTGLRVFELTPEIAVESCELPGEFHRDPADRIIVATARIHGIAVITKDRKILNYPHVQSFW